MPHLSAVVSAIFEPTNVWRGPSEVDALHRVENVFDGKHFVLCERWNGTDQQAEKSLSSEFEVHLVVPKLVECFGLIVSTKTR